MKKLVKQASKTAGLPPGTMVHIGDIQNVKTKITVIDYDEAQYTEKVLDKIEDCFEYRDKTSVSWINIDGVQDIGLLERVGAHFNIHPLVLEDIVHTDQRPKVEDYEDYIFIILKTLYLDPKSDEIFSEQISLVLGPNYVISFQEEEGDIFDPIRNRIRNNKGRVRKNKSDYLAYALLDCVVDNYYIILEKLGDQVEKMENEMMEGLHPETPHHMHYLKSELLFLRKQVWPLREMVNALQRLDSRLIKKTTLLFLRDIYDHTIHVIDTVETFRDMLAGLQDIYLSTTSHRMNEVIKVLTIITTIFIPLNFIAGIYGMNFKHMPELEWKWAYFIVLGLMLLTALVMLFFFKKKKWI